VIEVEVPHLPIQLVRTHVTFDEVIPCPLDGTQRVLGLSCKQRGSERNILNMTYRGRRDRCHGWYNAVTAVLLKAVYGKIAKVRDAIKRMLLSVLLFLVVKAELSSNKRKLMFLQLQIHSTGFFLMFC